MFSLILRPNSDPDWALVNLQNAAKNFEKHPRFPNAKFMCPRDGFVVIRHSELLAGNICKGTIGPSMKGLIFALIKMKSGDAAASFMNRCAKFSARWMANRGFSIGTFTLTQPSPRNSTHPQSPPVTRYRRRDAHARAGRCGSTSQPSECLRLMLTARISSPPAYPHLVIFEYSHPLDQVELKTELIREGYINCERKIAKFRAGQMKRSAGFDEEGTLESELVGELSGIRDTAGKVTL